MTFDNEIASSRFNLKLDRIHVELGTLHDHIKALAN
jgi:hypothetical protein